MLVYSCQPFAQCGGHGDRLNGIAAALAHLGTCAHTARFEFGANVVIQVLCYRLRLSCLIRQIIRNECNYN